MRFVLTADWHLREDRPRCRKDEDWIETQKQALMEIFALCRQEKADLYVVGDIFHRSTEFRMVRFVQIMADALAKCGLKLYLLYGNHDLRYHSSLNINSSAVGLLESSNNCHKISDNEEVSAPNFDEYADQSKEYIFIHTLCFPNMKSMPPNVNACCAKDLLEENPNAKWIFTGDYHKNFHYEWNGRHVVNSGCLLRQASDMKDYQCGVYYIDTEEEIVEFNPIIDNEELVDDSYIIEEKERDERIDNFLHKLSETKGVSLDFLDNVEKAMSVSDLDEDVRKMVNELIGG